MEVTPLQGVRLEELLRVFTDAGFRVYASQPEYNPEFYYAKHMNRPRELCGQMTGQMDMILSRQPL